MARKALRPCSVCRRTLTRETYCPQCKRAKDSERADPGREWYHTPRWRAARKLFLTANPWCVDDLEEGRYVPATVVDHDTPHRGDEALFWDESNWRPRCKPHHDQKTGREVSARKAE